MIRFFVIGIGRFIQDYNMSQKLKLLKWKKFNLAEVLKTFFCNL